MLFYHDVKNRKIIIVDMEPFFLNVINQTFV